LESSLSLADVDLTVDKQEAWVPAKPGEPVMAKAGEPYFHSASGERKATGSYFTPKFVVDHLVEQAIDPTIDRHLEKIAQFLRDGDQSTAAREFFDFRVGDLAMGSAHFLVAAIDRIEAKMRSFLANPDNTVPGVIDELARLRKAATEALKGDEIAIAEIEDSSLLRRQIARRCIYGIDVNDMAVELSRLAIWIHTFVPGLPMSSLNHNLVCANSLTGIGSIDEALDALIPNRKPGLPTMFDGAIVDGLDKAKNLLIEAARASEADKAEVTAGARLAAEAAEAAMDSKYIFDAAIASRFGSINPHELFTLESVVLEGKTELVQTLTSLHDPAHMPYLFPEVFLKENSGFDVLLGNPPWEKIKIEEHQWWGLRIPGLRGQPMAQRDKTLAAYRSSRPDLELQYESEKSKVSSLRDAIVKGPLRQSGASGDPDLYQAFAWRNWQLLRHGGILSLVLPRTAMSNAGLKSWRKAVLDEGSFDKVIFATNSRNWIFENVDPRYTVSFTTIQKHKNANVRFAGPFYSREEFEKGRKALAEVPVEDFAQWSDALSFPSIPGSELVEVFLNLKRQPSLVSERSDLDFEFTTDLHAAQDRDKFDTASIGGEGQIPVLSGASFNLWDPHFGSPYAYGSQKVLMEYQKNRIRSGVTQKRSAYFGMKPSDLYLNGAKPRIAFRAISRATDTRTLIACLIPPRSLCSHQANLIVNRKESASAEAFLLGVMCSIPFDWYTRCLTELNVSLEMLRKSPVPPLTNRPNLSLRMIELSGRLAAVSSDYQVWAREVGVEVVPDRTEVERFDMICEIDAIACLLYDLTAIQVRSIFENFQRGWDYNPRLTKVLEYYDQWKDK
jgi:hypothetical protein